MFQVPNDFARAYKEWAGLYETRIKRYGVEAIDLKEQRAWKQVESKWGDLRKYMRLQYQ